MNTSWLSSVVVYPQRKDLPAALQKNLKMSGINWFKRVLGFGPYFRRRSNALEGMIVASFLGITSGIYIWKPVFDEMETNRVNRERRELEQGGGGDNKNAQS